ncbi:MAG: hypothetical protein QM758_22480 [Armatimonas sp.]
MSPGAKETMRRAEWWLAALGFLLSALWAFRVPVPLGANSVRYQNYFPDEANHIAVVRYIATQKSLPPYNFEFYESAHPPLYHIGASVVWGLARPLLGESGAVRTLRLITALLGGWLVLLIFHGIRRASTYRVALLAAALAALLPGRAFLFGSVTNEALATLAGAGVFAALAHRKRLSLFLWSLIAAGTKLTGLTWVAGAVVLGIPMGGTVLLGALVALSPWALRNMLLYRDPLLIRLSEAIWSQEIPGLQGWQAKGGGAPGYFWLVARRGFESFIGVFDGMGRFLPGIAYLGTLSLPIYALTRRLRLRRVRRRQLAMAGALAFAGGLFIFFSYNLRHFSPQGRFLYGALAPLLWWLAESCPARLRLLPPLWLGFWSLWALWTM